MGLMQLRKSEQQQPQGGTTLHHHHHHHHHHDICSPTLSSLSKQTKMYNNALISTNNNNLMASITESKIPIVRSDDSKTSSRLSHHLHHMTLRGRSKVRVRTTVSVEHAASPTRLIRDNSITAATNYHKTIDSNSNPIITIDNNKSSDTDRLNKTGITLELNSATNNGNLPSGIPINNNNNNVKRGKRSLSSTRIDKDKCDEYNTKLLRKAANSNGNSSNSNSSTPTPTAAAAATVTSSSTSSTISSALKTSSLTRKIAIGGTSGLLAVNDQQQQNSQQTINLSSRNTKSSEQSMSLKLRKKISY